MSNLDKEGKSRSCKSRASEGEKKRVESEGDVRVFASGRRCSWRDREQRK